jgi:hypothetical protein
MTSTALHAFAPGSRSAVAPLVAAGRGRPSVHMVRGGREQMAHRRSGCPGRHVEPGSPGHGGRSTSITMTTAVHTPCATRDERMPRARSTRATPRASTAAANSRFGEDVHRHRPFLIDGGPLRPGARLEAGFEGFELGVAEDVRLDEATRRAPRRTRRRSGRGCGGRPVPRGSRRLHRAVDVRAALRPRAAGDPSVRDAVAPCAP